MKLVPKAITRTIGASVLKAKKNSPTLFFVGGVVGVVGSTVLACRATLKAEETIDSVDQKIKDVTHNQDGTKVDINKLTSHQRTDYVKDVAWVYTTSGYDLLKLYGPALALGVVSIGALTGSHVTLVRRNTALTAAVGSVTAAFNAYRERVQDAVGHSRERDIYMGYDTIVATDEEGNKVVTRRRTDGPASPYRQLFDEYSPRWEKNAEYNRNFVLLTERHFNQRLQANGHVFLNEVYDNLGFDRIPEGQMVGWVRDGDGAGYIDFGLDDVDSTDFMLGTERSVWLSFNVDGVVYDKI